ncbi:MAG TPA: hemolysin family protein [Acidobacteriaceae bacterium]|jgi:CBS domain containing-hemolysin-like protein|nr:hemolysin family protein [Acidobacteriaceae bacterium]
MLEWLLVHGSLIAFFILANSFFVAAEFALVTVRETRIEQLIAAGRPAARTVLYLKRHLDEFLSAVQLGVTLAALALGALGEPVVAQGLMREFDRVGWMPVGGAVVYAHALAVAIAFAVITYFEVSLGELVPKALALQRAERVALAVAGPMDAFLRMTRPAVTVMNASARAVLRLFRAPLRGETAAHSPEELKLMVTATRRVGLLPAFQEEMIHRAIELREVAVSEIMTPRGKIFSLPADMPLEAASARIVEEQHTRVPVYDPERGREHIIGMVHWKDVARLMHFRSVIQGTAQGMGNTTASGLTLRQIMRDVQVVPETKPALELLEEFKARRRWMAIVVDEFGSTLGLVTAEDLLEQVVGELEDEFDTGRTLPLASPEGGLLLDGSASLRDLTTQLHWKLPRETGVETLAGLLLARFGHLPQPGEQVEIAGRRFTVIEVERRRIAKVRVEELTPAAEQEQRAAQANGVVR